MKRYYSRADKWVVITLLASIFLMWLPLIPLWDGDSNTLSLLMTLLVIASTWLISSILLHTYYWFDKSKIHWKTGPFKGSIEIADIRKITRAKSLMDISALMKPCLTHKPLLIRYNQFDDLPISPREEREFIEELIRKNDKIEMQLNTTK